MQGSSLTPVTWNPLEHPASLEVDHCPPGGEMVVVPCGFHVKHCGEILHVHLGFPIATTDNRWRRRPSWMRLLHTPWRNVFLYWFWPAEWAIRRRDAMRKPIKNCKLDFFLLASCACGVHSMLDRGGVILGTTWAKDAWEVAPQVHHMSSTNGKSTDYLVKKAECLALPSSNFTIHLSWFIGKAVTP